MPRSVLPRHAPKFKCKSVSDGIRFALTGGNTEPCFRCCRGQNSTFLCLELGDGVMTFELVMLQASRGYRWGTLEQKFHNTTEGKDLCSSLFIMT